ncbi:MAG: major capsid protein, partial [Planctomycetota bacterium]
MALTDTTASTSVINSEFIVRSALCANAQSVFAPGGPGRQFISVKDLTGKGTKTASWPVEPSAITAYPVTEGVDHTTSQSITLTDTPATVAEYVAITTITDLDRDVSLEDELARATRFCGYAHGNKIDSVIMALFNALSTDCGSTAADATWILLSNGPQTLHSANFNGPYGAILHPFQWRDLMIEG